MMNKDGRYKLIVDNLARIIEAKKNKDESITISIEGRKYRVKVDKISENKFIVKVNDDELTITLDDDHNIFFVDNTPYRARIIRETTASTRSSIKIPFVKETISPLRGKYILSPITGRIIDIKVKYGDKISKGDLIAIIESMKIRNEVLSDKSGVVKKLFVSIGQVVKKGGKIVEIE